MQKELDKDLLSEQEEHVDTLHRIERELEEIAKHDPMRNVLKQGEPAEDQYQHLVDRDFD